MEDANGEGVYLMKIPVSSHVSLYLHLHRCIPYCAFYQLMTACACACAKINWHLAHTRQMLQACFVGVSLIMITCVYLLHVISAVIVLALQLQFHIVLS